MDTEDLIRDALRARAEQTPPAGHVLAALHRPRKSRKPLFLAVTAATAAAAVAVVATTVGRPSAEAPAAASTTLQTTSTTTTKPTTVAAAPLDPRTLGYSPSWLVDGLTERNRFVDPTGAVQRVWKHSSEQLHTPSLNLLVPKDVAVQEVLRQQIAGAPAADQVTINGSPALVVDPTKMVLPRPGEPETPETPATPDGTPPDARVVFSPEPGHYVELVLSNAPRARADAIRIAESTRPDQTALGAPVSVGGALAHQARVNSRGWHVSTTGEIGGVTYGANLSSFVDDPIGNPSVAPVTVTARGVSAEYLGQLVGYLRVDLRPDLHLLVHGPGPGTASAQELIAAAEALTVDVNATGPWATG
ncbi:hypothetical protein B0I31_101844 [Saccharothrix carnea]|uniref:Uncharacterized protein n=1 Tax=Saccharothrix carnea TaxID=1280637 RepID=A0A2P8IJH4_SACCR|nr:hypothetical protein [Saccharothrix carnea]PSL58623.1 hypothetical protein B0I31_101844 [Saccharothrix carnea]